ncbi:hypothetical protein [Kitasatospora sp. NPDC004531]
MDLPLLTAAVERGDTPALRELLDRLPTAAPAGEAGSALLAAAAYRGADELVAALVEAGADASRPWPGGVDPVVWAACNGHVRTLWHLLANLPPGAAEDAGGRALAAARATIDAGPGLPPPGVWGVVTELEAGLGVRHSPGELLARALVHGRSDCDDWFASLLPFGRRPSADLFHWARARYLDAPSAPQRRFALDAIRFLDLGIDEFDEDTDPVDAFRAEAAAFLRPLIDREPDPEALACAISAFASFHSSAPVTTSAGSGRPELPQSVLAHRDHPEQSVRCAVANAVAGAVKWGARDRRPETVSALLGFTADPFFRIRAVSLHALYEAADVDAPAARAAIAARLHDPVREVAIQAAGALARRGDSRGFAALDEVEPELTNRHDPNTSLVAAIRWRLASESR